MTDPQLRSLLLHRLPVEETVRLEDAILVEEGFAERLCSEEFDLLEDYAASRLSAAEAGDVERHLLTSEQSRLSLQVAHALRKLINTAERRAPDALLQRAASAAPRRRTSPVWGVATLLAACLAIVVYVPQWQSRWRLGTGRSASTSSSDGTPGTVDTVPTISLMADVDRGPSQPPLVLPAGAGQIRLQAEVSDPTPDTRYSLSIQDEAGRRLFAAPALEVHTAGRYQYVEIPVPADALGPGERTVSLTVPGLVAIAQAKFTWHLTARIQ